MPYQLQKRYSIPAEIKRIVTERTDKAIDKLTQEIKTNDTTESNFSDSSCEQHTEAIHQARKRFKEIRAAVRLVKSELGKEVYKRENNCFRDAGRRLSTVRDAQVLLETFNKLKKHFAEFINPEGFIDLQQVLVEHYNSTTKRAFEEENAVIKVLTDIKNARERIPSWSLESSDSPINFESWFAANL